MLALQALGATAGNMICINNIIAARAAVGGDAKSVHVETYIRNTATGFAIMVVVGTLIAVLFMFA
jgi:L-lactate permease